MFTSNQMTDLHRETSTFDVEHPIFELLNRKTIEEFRRT